ncbi:MAG: acetyl-CoA carboxylase carboxyltransferase subunit alpha [Coriobacteriales bacterium]|jgi:acetyl-CoA carboxylase carboxyl transferase subunit beta|nr:acetyl-CoA carboxylase carboxyltransferase subunit alpha [Coriobacteriales bacterium]
MAGIFDLFLERKAKLEALATKRKAQRAATKKLVIKSHIDEVLDPRSAQPLFTDIRPANPLDFPGYAEKIALSAKRTGYPDAGICRAGTIEGRAVICAELLPEFMMGSMGVAVGETITRAAEYALEQGMPLIIFSASGGARMQEGMFSLMQMAKTAAAIQRLSQAGGLFISVLTHPTTGGVTASFASLGDIILAEPGALIGFAGPRVIEQTIGSKLPEGFQSAEFQLAHGFVDAVVPRAALRQTLARILRLHPGVSAKRAAQAPSQEDAAPMPSPAQALPAITPQQQVELARAVGRPHVRDFIDGLLTDFVELHGDRLYSDDNALLCGLACFEGRPVTVAGHIKGADLTSNIASNFGMPHPEGYRKFIRVAQQAQKFGRPLITFIDTPGAYPGAQAEERGQGSAIAQCLFELSRLEVPIVAFITGEGGSGGALALGVADRLIMLEHAVYSVLSPEGFASILWKDAKRAPEACEVMKLTAQDLLAFGMVDVVAPEPAGSAAANPQATFETLRPLLRRALDELGCLDTPTLLQQRYDRYRKFG